VEGVLGGESKGSDWKEWGLKGRGGQYIRIVCVREREGKEVHGQTGASHA